MKGKNRFNTEINIKGAKKKAKYSVQTKLRIGPRFNASPGKKRLDRLLELRYYF